MKFHKEGKGSLILSFIIFSTLSVLGFCFLNKSLWIPIVIAIISLILFFLVVWFFRYPNRKITAEDNIVVCPADGKVVVIEKTFEQEFLKNECWQVSVFMSPLNVHINWYPVNGIVKQSFYHKGKYLVAWHPKSSSENERSSVLIQTKTGKQIVVRQIAGALARRIVTYAKIDDESSHNQQLGFIKFGSRVDIFLPLETVIKVEIGQKVKGNHTIIAENI